MTTLGEQGAPIKGLDPEAVQLQGIAELLGQLQRIGGLIRIGLSRADAVLPGLGTGWVGGPRRHGRPQTHPGTRHVEGDPCPFSFRAAFWQLSQGSEGSTGFA